MKSRRIAGTLLELVQGDITKQDTDAIVNAANTTLFGGGGVDGAIHRAGGPSIVEECRRLGGCATGDAKLTGAGRLSARHVIHAVGPVYRDGRHGEAELLASAYRRSLEVAMTHGLRSVAFPSILTGAYRFPFAEAAAIAPGTVAAVAADRLGARAVGAGAANPVHPPARTLVAVGGLGVGALPGPLTGGDIRAAYAVWVPAAGGTFMLTPAHFEGTRPIEFFGSDYADRPSTNARDTSIAYRSLYMY